jgi:hypothetical protein
MEDEHRVSNPDSPPNNRRTQRRRSLLSGKIAYNNGSYTLSCTIRDLSEVGAKVRIPNGQVLPSQVFLIDIREGCAYDSAVKWQGKTEAGLEFRHKIGLGPDCPEEFRYLRRLLVEASPR